MAGRVQCGLGNVEINGLGLRKLKLGWHDGSVGKNATQAEQTEFNP